MTTPDSEMPAANRAESEIGFVLRRAKWRRGTEVMRDVARAESARREAKSEMTAEPARTLRGGRTAI